MKNDRTMIFFCKKCRQPIQGDIYTIERYGNCCKECYERIKKEHPEIFL